MATVDFVRQFPAIDFTKGTTMLRDGETTEYLYAIKSGYVKVTSIDEAGNQRLLWIAGRYDIVPTEYLFLRRKPLNFFYTALTDGSAYKLDKSKFLSQARTDVSLMTDIAVAMSTHYDVLLARLNSIEQATVTDKILSTLCYLASRFSAEDVTDLHEIGLLLTHRDLADMIGSTRETVSLELQKLRQTGCIQYDRTMFRIDRPACEAQLVR